MVGVALRHDTAGGDHRDLGVLHVGDRSSGLDAVKGGHGILGLEGLLGHLLQQHLDAALGAADVGEVVDADAPLVVAFHGGTQDLFTLGKLLGQSSHHRHGLAHVSGGVAGGDDEQILAEHVDAGVLHVHTGHHGDAQLILHSLGDGAAGHAVTAGVEGGAGHEQLRLVLGDHVQQLGGVLFQVGAEVAVAADRGGNDLELIAQALLQSSTGANDAGTDLGGNIGLLLAADLGEELVDVVNDSDFIH